MYSIAIIKEVSEWERLNEIRGAIFCGHTFRQDLPFTRFRASVRWDGFVQVLEEIFHLASSLTFRELVAHAQLGSSTVVAGCL